MNPETQQPEDPIPCWRWRRRLLAFCAAVLLVVLGGPVATIVFGNNFRTLLPGRIYRSAQLNDDSLKRAVEQYGIRTIVNLRGLGLGMDWYHAQARKSHRCNISMEDIGMSAGRLPSVTELRRLVRVLDQSEYPILIHCKQGIDRTGLVSALALLLYTDTDVKTARGQLGLRYGHLSVGRTVHMGRFFDLYESWLAGRGEPHSREAFRRWLEHEYTSGPASARLEWIELPCSVAKGKPSAVRVRAWNTSAQTWRFEPGTTAGIHCGFMLIDANGDARHKGRGGLFRADVPPGACIDLTLPLPPIQQTGAYYLLVDMMDESQQSYFYQHGAQPLVRELVIGP